MKNKIKKGFKKFKKYITFIIIMLLLCFISFYIGKRGIMPKNMVIYYNQIDIGIFLCFLELCLEENKIKYDKMINEEENHEQEENLCAIYQIRKRYD